MIRIFHHYVSKIAFLLLLLELMAPDATIVCSGSEPGRTRTWTLAELLPGAFDDF